MPTIPHPTSTSRKGEPSASMPSGANENAQPPAKRRPRVLSLEGQRFGRLVVLSRHGTRHRVSTWLCRCDCGVEKVMYSHHMKRGEAISCGCARTGSAGGKAAHAKGVAHKFTSEEAREAGRKGGLAPRRKRTPKEKKPRDPQQLMNTKTPQARFCQQRNGARRRGIGWEFTFDEWWAVWERSGKWAQRGIKKGCYVMARFGDVGPYSPANVSIIRHEENIAQALAARALPISAYRSRRTYKVGYGKGWSFNKKALTKPYEAVFRERGIGSFDTAEEAHAAYLSAAALFLSQGTAE